MDKPTDMTFSELEAQIEQQIADIHACIKNISNLTLIQEAEKYVDIIESNIQYYTQEILSSKLSLAETEFSVDEETVANRGGDEYQIFKITPLLKQEKAKKAEIEAEVERLRTKSKHYLRKKGENRERRIFADLECIAAITETIGNCANNITTLRKIIPLKSEYLSLERSISSDQTLLIKETKELEFLGDNYQFFKELYDTNFHSVNESKKQLLLDKQRFKAISMELKVLFDSLIY
ncbi:hypothetical protein [Dyadobacter psychrophilus]|uniref:Uncharacterized protein n=1 Tax=Dyadobacter psychrophilus TaxID=651661 RepID=A0A1T5HFV2_9BACT|nr:hypothetical protein [Dyadobacter psychrophilus]SKC19565.1 hypothetical protein SAMN05660293_05484 [Dyadobacter psychrophilus]